MSPMIAKRARTATPTPAPMPALAPVLSPEDAGSLFAGVLVEVGPPVGADAGVAV